MADNENEGSSRSFRQNPGNKKRREPPIIDGKATDISEAPSGAASENGTQSETSYVPEAKSVAAEEPVLFGQALRGSSSASAETEPVPDTLPETVIAGAADPAAANDAVATTQDADTPSSIDTATETSAKSDPDEASKEPDPSVFGSTGYGAPPPPNGESMPAFMVPPQPRSPAATILGGIAVLLLLVIAGLLFAGQQRGGTEDLKAALDAANGRLAALEARPDPSSLASKLTQLDQRTVGVDTDLAALKQTADDLSKRLSQAASEAQANAAKLAALDSAATIPAVPAAGPEAPGGSSPSPTEAPVASATALAALAGRLDDLTHQMAALPTEPAPAADLGPLQRGITSLSERLDALSAPARGPAQTPLLDLVPLQAKVSDIAQRVDSVQATLAALPKTDLGPLEEQVADLVKKVQGFDRGLSTLSATVEALPKVDLAPLQAGLAATEQRLTPIETALATPKTEDRITEARATGSADISRAAPLAVVAQTASRSIEEGRPMVAEVDALRALGIDDAALVPLSAVAEKGAPTTAALKAQWGEVEPAVTAAIRPHTGNSLLDKFAAGARQIVLVRKVGAPVGDDPASEAARIPAALDDGDVGLALAAWSKLPENARTTSQAWADAAQSRLAALTAAQGLAARAIETLAKAKG